MHTVVGETDGETSIHLTAYGYFLNDESKQVITVASKLLRLFRINPYYCGDENESFQENAYTPRMECIAQFSFLAPISAISKVRLPGFQFDAIVTCFEDAKLTVQYIDPARRELEIVSLHEIHQDILCSVYEKLHAKDFVASDPEGRCVIALVRDAFFLVIPIPEKLGLEFFDEYEDEQQHVVKRPKPKLTNYDIKLHDLDKHFHGVSDFIIPSGQYVPTAIVLYEPKKNTAGRALIDYDTFCVAAISFDLKERQTAITWQVQGLPMSLQRMIHIPEPVSGLLLCGVNELIYLHQYAPAYGVSLNSNAAGFSKFAFHEANIVTTFDGVVVELLSPYEILLGSRAGELFIATIDTDAMNSVRSISIQKVSDIPIPSSIINLSRGFVFVTSKINDSALLSYTKVCKSRILPSLEEIKNAGQVDEEYLEQLDPDSEDYQKTVSHYFYGETDEEVAILEAPITQQEYTFTLIHTLLNTAPFKKTVPCVAEEVDDAFKDTVQDQVFDIAAATGHEKDGKLLFMERTVRPHIGSSIPLKGISCCFTAGRLHDKNQSHRYVFLSREMDTMVLDSTKNLSEHHTTPFCKTEGTIYAGDLHNGIVVCQICVHRINFIKDNKLCEEIVIDSDNEIYVTDADIKDPYVAVSLSNNSLLIIHVKLINDEVVIERLPTDKISEITEAKTTCLTLYRDTSGLFIQRKSDNSNALPKMLIYDDEDDQILLDNIPEDADEISKYFYTSKRYEAVRESNVEKNRRLRTSIIDQEFDNWKPQFDTSMPNPSETSVNYFLILAKEDGSLYFFVVPSFECVYVSPNASSLWTTLVDDPRYGNYNSSLGFEPPESNQPLPKRSMVMDGIRAVQASRICEVRIFGTGSNGSRPILSILVDDTITFFEAFPFDNYLDNHLMIRFKKLEKFVCVRRQPYIIDDNRQPVETISIGSKIRSKYMNFVPKMGSMENVIIITGGYPMVLFVGANGIFQHPLSIDGAIKALCYLCTPSIAHGFVYVKDEMIRIGEVSKRYPEVIYDTPYPCRKVSMGCTISHITYILPFNIFAIATSIHEEYSSIWSVNNDEHQEQKCTVNERFVLPKRQKFIIRLFTREDYQFIPNSDMNFKDFENVTCLEEVIISTLGSKTGLMNYLAIGTAFNMGEEVPARGRLLIYEIIEVVPEVGMPTTRFKLKSLAELDQKGPVSSISSTEGVLMVAIGQRVFVYTIKDEGLVANSFLDLKFYISQICPLRSLALCLDMFASVHLLRYQKDFKVLSEIASDDRRICPRANQIEYVINNQNVAMVMGDFEKNLLVLENDPESPESKFAQRLLVRGGIRIGVVISSFIRVHAHVADSMVTRLQTTYNAQSTMFTTKEGSWGFVRPVSERSYRRLFMLQNFIENQFQQLGGLNTRGARAVRPQITGTEVNFSNAKQLIDGDLLLQFCGIDVHDKDEVSRRLGTTKYQITDDLIELMRIVRHF